MGAVQTVQIDEIEAAFIDSRGNLVRDFKPVKLKNGLVVLWDFVENKPYLPQSKTAPYNFTTFPVVGSDGDRIYTSARVIIR